MIRRLSLFALVFAVTACDGGEDEPDRIDDILALTGDPAAGLDVYTTRSCGSCHGDDGAGSADFPSLVDTLPENTDRETLEVIIDGGSGMPAAGDLQDQALADLLAYLNSEWG